MDNWQRLTGCSRTAAATVVVTCAMWGSACADPPAVADPPAAVDAGAGAPPPKQSFLSSLTQAFKQDFDHEVVRGHFDVGTPPDIRRYYCLVDEKTGKRQPNGVPGEPKHRADGMTGITASSVSIYTCAGAEEQGTLVTTGYVLNGRTASGAAQPAAPPPAPAPPPPANAASPTSPDTSPDTSPGRVDVGGVKLGTTPDEVRAALRAKRLLDYYESTQALGNGRFVNVISAWTPGDEGESYEVMFTPVPGRERAMAIVHSVGYAGAGGIREKALAAALGRKYGGYAAGDVPRSPTWRVQASGSVQVGDACNRRTILTEHGAPGAGTAATPNLALKTTLEEFRFQIDNCGITIVTEDHSLAEAGAAHDEPVVKRYTVTAYGPAIGFEGASLAAQSMQAPAGTSHPNAARARDEGSPSL